VSGGPRPAGRLGDAAARVIWSPPEAPDRRPRLREYLSWLRATRGLALSGYDELWRWSVTELEEFWGSIWEFFGVRSHAPYEQVLRERVMPGASWFEGARINYAEQMLAGDGARIAVVAHSQTRAPLEVTLDELREQVARARAGLAALGVRSGDRVAAYAPNIPETLVAYLASASLGAIFSTCAPELGPRSVATRIGAIGPRVLIAVAGYTYGDRRVDRRAEVAQIRAEVPSLEHVVHLPYAGGDDDELPAAISWEALLADSAPLAFAELPFEHPLCILFSSGTTGIPKAIVHSHGGIVVEHLKNHGLSWDLQAGERIMWFSTTSWMLWYSLVSGLLLGASIVMVDGNLGFPDLAAYWRLAELTRPSVMGVSPAYLMACRGGGVELAGLDLGSLLQIGAAGSPLPADGYDWVYEQLGDEILLNVGSGGTDVCSGFVQGSPLQPVYRGEIAGPCLGVDAAAYDPDGRPVLGRPGEFVIRSPMPSMPVAFWGDTDGSRYRASYFEQYPGVWRQGDWAIFSERGSCVITGRSDATLNRGGVRLGTGEFYSVLESLPEVSDSLVVHLEDAEGGPGELIVFVALRGGAELDEELRARIAGALRSGLSPRHVPDTIEAVPLIPRTLSGKKLEVPVKQILLGAQPEHVTSRDALAEPSALDAFVALAAARAAGA
jgi:acetoacetyl-CoA synthetase